jgi:hypothetical protein
VAATGVNFLIVVDNDLDYGSVANGFLFPGQSHGPIPTDIFRAQPPAQGEMRMLVTCRDRLSVLHVFTPDGVHRRYKPGLFRGPVTPSKQELFADAFPGVVLAGKADVHTGHVVGPGEFG